MKTEPSEKELVVIAGLADGKGVKEIAHEQGLGYYTTQSRIRMAMEKTETHTAAGLVALALRHGWIE